MPDLQSLDLNLNGFCDQGEITLITEWLPRRVNERTDFLSKLSPADDCSIGNWVFNHLNRAWDGPSRY